MEKEEKEKGKEKEKESDREEKRERAIGEIVFQSEAPNDESLPIPGDVKISKTTPVDLYYIASRSRQEFVPNTAKYADIWEGPNVSRQYRLYDVVIHADTLVHPGTYKDTFRMRKRQWPDQDDGVELLPDLDNVETVGSLFEFHGRFVVYKIPGGSKLPSALKLVTRHVNRSPKSVTTYRLQVESPMRLGRLNIEFRKFLAGKAKLGK